MPVLAAGEGEGVQGVEIEVGGQEGDDAVVLHKSVRNVDILRFARV